MLGCEIPYEHCRKVFRLFQKNIERELGAVQTASKDVAKRAGVMNQEEAVQSVQAMINRVDSLKRKVRAMAYSRKSYLRPLPRPSSYQTSRRLSVDLRKTSCERDLSTWSPLRLLLQPELQNTPLGQA